MQMLKVQTSPSKAHQALNVRLREAQRLQERGALAEAAKLYQQYRDAAPQAFEGWHWGGMVALRLNRISEAESLLTVALERKPGCIQTVLGLGMARLAGGDAAGAERVLREAAMKQPSLAEAWHYLALALKAQRRVREVLAIRERLVRNTPGSATAWANLGNARLDVGSITSALEAFEKAIELDGSNPRTRLSRATALFKAYRVAEAAAEFAKLAGDTRVRWKAWSSRLMALNYLPEVAREEVWRAHQEFGAAVGSPEKRVWLNLRDAGRRLRLAVLSPDLNQHSVAYFLEPLLRELDRSAFEIVLYHDSAKVDATSERLRGYAALWRNFANRPDDAVEEAILRDVPDVLVDLTGHAGTNRLPLLARRVAPVQITYLGYPNTTGVPAIDYRLVDEITDPTGDAESCVSEKLIRFAPTAWSYLPPSSAPEVGMPPALANGVVTFGSFNNFVKVTDPMLRVWSRILAAVPGSRLLVKAAGMDDEGVRDGVRRRLREAGIAEDRVRLEPQVRETAAHLAMYGQVDVALDAFPYHGTTTTCEALWMGVPVVTREGDRHASRVGASLLKAIGRSEWIAANDDDYVRIAAELAKDVAGLARIRTTLRVEMQASELLNHAGQARRFADALRACWAAWCEAGK
jgi:Predicted O-linked N-acetylglucosamine transferase, SPINDLY family